MTKPLFERHRPTAFSEVVGQPKAIGRLSALLAGSGLGGRAYWISGPSGCGKTTLARLIARHVAGESGLIEDQDAQELTPRLVREISESLNVPTLFGGRVWIFNESHGMRRDGLRALLVALEAEIPSDSAFIFTTSSPDLPGDLADGAALLSRCVQLPLVGGQNPSWQAAIAKRALAVAERENLGGDPATIAALVERHKGNFRAVLNSVECGELDE